MISKPWQIFLIAVVVRIVAAIGLNYYLSESAQRDYLIEGDAEGYWTLAEKMVAGEEYSLYSPPRQVMRMPGFPAVLTTSISLFGNSQESARFLLAIFASLAVFPAYWLGEKYHSRSAGIVAAYLIALMPVYVGFSVLVLSESLFATCILFNIWAISKWLESEQVKASYFWAAIAGLLCCAAVYIRPSWLLFPPFFIFVLSIFIPGFFRKRILQSAVMCLCLLLPLLPWGLRNQQVTGHFVITTLWMGPSLYDGLHPAATGASDMTFFEQDNVLSRMSEYEMNRYYRDQAIQFAWNNPGRAVELGLIKLWRFWKPWPNASQFRNPILMLVIASGFLFLSGWAIYGGWEVTCNLRFLFLCTLPIVYFALLHTLFVSSVRYRLPAEYPLAVLASIGIVEFFCKSGRNKSCPSDGLQ